MNYNPRCIYDYTPDVILDMVNEIEILSFKNKRLKKKAKKLKEKLSEKTACLKQLEEFGFGCVVK